MNGARKRRTNLMKLALICCIFLAMATLYARAAGDSIEKLADGPACVRGLAWIEKSASWVTDQQVRLTEIPAPELKEAQRAEFFKNLLESTGLKVHVDQTGNVIAERPGSDANSVILLAAHLDTVFPAGTDVRVKRNSSRLAAPGIADNGAGLAALAGLARALSDSRLQT
ncbi:MAG: M28 family peptidase, partial [Candidatus Acidiferrales bacterium]